VLTGTLKQGRRLIVAVVGVTVLVAGIAMLALPGPGMLVIALGLGILGAEFVWARRLLRRLKRAGEQIAGAVLPAGEPAAKSHPPTVRSNPP
jgi:uncharacterized protein (TIGR02611 family)